MLTYPKLPTTSTKWVLFVNKPISVGNRSQCFLYRESTHVISVGSEINVISWPSHLVISSQRHRVITLRVFFVLRKHLHGINTASLTFPTVLDVILPCGIVREVERPCTEGQGHESFCVKIFLMSCVTSLKQNTKFLCERSIRLLIYVAD